MARPIIDTAWCDRHGWAHGAIPNARYLRLGSISLRLWDGVLSLGVGADYAELTRRPTVYSTTRLIETLLGDDEYGQ